MSAPSEDKSTGLRYLRDLAGLAQANASDDFGVDVRTLRDWERESFSSTPETAGELLAYYSRAIERRLHKLLGALKKDERLLTNDLATECFAALKRIDDAIVSLRRLSQKTAGKLSAADQKKRIQQIIDSILPNAVLPEPPIKVVERWPVRAVMILCTLCLAIGAIGGRLVTARKTAASPLLSNSAAAFSSPSIITRYEAPVWGPLPGPRSKVRLYIKPEDKTHKYYLDDTETKETDHYWVKPAVRFGDEDEAHMEAPLPLHFKVFVVIADAASKGFPGEGKDSGTEYKSDEDFRASVTSLGGAVFGPNTVRRDPAGCAGQPAIDEISPSASRVLVKWHPSVRTYVEFRSKALIVDEAYHTGGILDRSLAPGRYEITLKPTKESKSCYVKRVFDIAGIP